MATPTDPLFSQQWHLPMIGNIRKIWDEFTGHGVSVVVYDDGVQASHADLAANYDASQHFRFNGTTYLPTPNSARDAHGTACAGIIAAVDNNGRGGVGVANGARITGIDYLNDLQSSYNWDTQQTSPMYDALMRWASRFDIMSNSWGTTPDFSAQLNPTIAGNSSAVDAVHFGWVSAHGRGGLGTIVVKAAGNETMDANGEGSNVSRHSITVAATERDGFVASYSNYGASILITAPAAAVTTDLSGAQGYASGDYTMDFNGTSAATPVVSGVVALMLDANAGLGWRDVQSILALSAQHTGSAVGVRGTGAEVGNWLTMGGEHWNGGGAIYHLSYGFGMVDAFAATRMAEVWTRLNGAADTSANELRIVRSSSTAVTMRDSDGNANSAEATLNFAVTQDIQIDSVQARFTITHAYASEVEIYLQGPSGQKVNLFAIENENTLFDGGLTWTFAAEAFRGMSSKGTWKLMFHDNASGDQGVVRNARLEFFGSAASANDVYHFTDDFRTLRNLQADRRAIDDADGGIDWLNFAGVSGNVSVNMAASGAVKLNGVTLATLGAGVTDFERLQAGDGADVVTGNALANRIYGGRGSDRLAGGRGNDLLVGERGNDRLTGGAGADQFEFRRGDGQDRITDWTNDVDTLRLDDAIWGGGMNVSAVLTEFADVVSGSVVLAFGAGMQITLQGLTSIASLRDDITII